MNNKTQRDRFWDAVYELAKGNRNIIVVSADMGAPSLDRFRKDFPSQYIDAGVAEQNAVLVASGLAIEGKTPFFFAIAPFATMRCFEQIRNELNGMNIPVHIVGVGAGIGYDDAEYTHHSVEDIGILRTLQRLIIFSVTDGEMAGTLPRFLSQYKRPTYTRLDRMPSESLYSEDDLSEFCGVHKFKDHDSCFLVATGNMVYRAIDVAAKLDIGVIDLYRFPINQEIFIREIGAAKKIFTLEEHVPIGGLGDAVNEVVMNKGIKVYKFALDFSDGYCSRYGGREFLQSLYGIDTDSVCQKISPYLECQTSISIKSLPKSYQQVQPSNIAGESEFD